MSNLGRDDSLGRAIVEQADVYSGATGKRVNIIKNLMSVDVYEDIYSPFVHCDLVIIDYDSLAKQFPLMGEEYFELSFKSREGKSIAYQFLLYKNDTGGHTPTNTAKGYVLRGVTLERAFDSVKTVSSAFWGSYSKIAGNIFDGFVKKDTGLNFFFEPSAGVGRYVVPQISPLSAIEYCRSRAVSTSAAKSPFVFFRNSKGYTFMSLNGLFNKEAAAPAAQIIHQYAARDLPAYFKDKPGSGTKVDIVQFDIVTFYDSMSKIDMGAFNTHTYSFDLTTKSFVLRNRFNLVDSSKKMQLGGVGQYNRDGFTKLFKNSRCNAIFLPTDVGRELDKFQPTSIDILPDHAGEMHAYSNLVSEYNIHYTIYGDSDVTAGQVMKISVPQATSITTERKSRFGTDPMYSGNFLCARVKHTLTFSENVEYYVRISAINGARHSSAEEIVNG